jgi:hypothetical protein
MLFEFVYKPHVMDVRASVRASQGPSYALSKHRSLKEEAQVIELCDSDIGEVTIVKSK